MKLDLSGSVAFLKSVEAKFIGLIMCTLPLLVHTSYTLFMNELPDLNIYLRWCVSILAAIGLEFTIMIATLDESKRFKWIAYVFAIFSIVINWNYNSSGLINKFLAFVLPFSVLVYSELVKTTSDGIPKRRRRRKEKDGVESEIEAEDEDGVE